MERLQTIIPRRVFFRMTDPNSFSASLKSTSGHLAQFWKTADRLAHGNFWIPLRILSFWNIISLAIYLTTLSVT